MDALEKAKYVNSVAQQLLVSEIVPLSIRITSKKNCEMEEKKDEEKEGLKEIVLDQTRIDTKISVIEGDVPGSIVALDSMLLGDDEVTVRIESYGYSVGFKIAEIMLLKSSTAGGSFQNGRNKMLDILDIMKFVCRDVWSAMYGKQVDNLRTNHRGTFVLVDSNFKYLKNLTSNKGTTDTIIKSKAYLHFPCGVIRGILMSFGIEAETTSEITQLPAVNFSIQTRINN